MSLENFNIIHAYNSGQLEPKGNHKFDMVEHSFLEKSTRPSFPIFEDNHTRSVKREASTSDEFKVDHSDGKHILFAGCSISVPIGIKVGDSWAKLTYDEISKEQDCTGYYNCSISGASVLEIIYNVFKYIRHYGYPETIFLLLPSLSRDLRYIITGKKMLNIIYNQYMILDTVCRTNNVRLISNLWSDPVPGLTDWIVNGDDYSCWELLKDFDSYYTVDLDRFSNSLIEYTTTHGAKTMIGSDDAHPGEAMHYAWYKEMIAFYRSEKQL